MKYTVSAYDKAEAVLSQRRKDSRDELSRREAYANEHLPEIKSLRDVVRNTYFELVKIVASHAPDAKERAEKVRDENLNARRRIAIMLTDLTGDPDYLKPKYVCEKCRDMGYVEGIRCDCMEELIKKYTVEELNASSTVMLHDFSEYNPAFYPDGENRERMNEYFRYFKSYCEHFPHGCRSMLFMGQTGLGKTFLSSCIAKAIAENGYTAAFGSVSDFLRKIENEHFGRSEGNTLDTLLAADLVIIDDLGSEFSGAFYEATIYNLINGRINLRRPTIISTNLTEAQFNARYNERISSRVFNDFMPIMFVGKDIRQQKANRLYGKKE
jgi:DNA replication protein DnaC